MSEEERSRSINRQVWGWATKRASKLIDDIHAKHGTNPEAAAAATVAACVLMHTVAINAGTEGFMRAMNASLAHMARRSSVHLAVMCKERQAGTAPRLWTPRGNGGI